MAEAKAVELKGTTSNVEDGQTVTLTVTDVNGKQVTFTATVTDGIGCGWHVHREGGRD
ncbi:hypothetical protein [Aeromonas caviae]|uniref:hypothetical protein n=1 Tax=Aeromonas caviae TaxID=648 RepID=UPI002E214DE1